jgi:hypothetical protein
MNDHGHDLFGLDFAGNVLGMQNQKLLTDLYQYQSCYNGTEFAFTDQVTTSTQADAANNLDAVIMWSFSEDQAENNIWVNSTINTQLRNGNFNWVTKTQQWEGIGGSDGSVAPQPIPNSLYLTAKPAFFGSNPWPWVDPTTGTTYTLPAGGPAVF